MVKGNKIIKSPLNKIGIITLYDNLKTRYFLELVYEKLNSLDVINKEQHYTQWDITEYNLSNSYPHSIPVFIRPVLKYIASYLGVYILWIKDLPHGYFDPVITVKIVGHRENVKVCSDLFTYLIHNSNTYLISLANKHRRKLWIKRRAIREGFKTKSHYNALIPTTKLIQRNKERILARLTIIFKGLIQNSELPYDKIFNQIDIYLIENAYLQRPGKRIRIS